jgi:membrane protease YdiL (CAAX protease family)
MAASSEIEAPPPALSFRDVPWRWSDVAIGFIPALLMLPIPLLVSRETLYALPRWLWIVLASIQLGWMFAYPVGVARRRSGLPQFPSLGRVLREAPLALVAVLIVMVIQSVMFSFLTKGSDRTSAPFEAIAGAPEPYQAVALVILAVGVAPLAEEIFFRGMLYNLLRKRMHFLSAALIQGVAFGLVHPFGLKERVAIMVIGLCLALMYQWRKTLVAPILLHAMINALSLGILFYSLAIAANAPVLGVKGETREQGCVVTEVVPGGAAEEAGILVGDVIGGAGENSVRNLGDLVSIMRMKKVGDRIPVWYIRDGKTYQVEAILKARPK